LPTTINLQKLAASGLLGLHFTPEELFLAYGQRRGRGFTVSALDVIDIRQHVLEGGDYNHTTLVPLLQNALKRHHVRPGTRAVISFPVKFPWIREIEVPNLPDRELDRVVRLEVERLYLDSTVEKLIDYYPLEDGKTKEAGSNVRVLSCAIPRNSVAPYSDLLASAKIDLAGIDLVEVNVLKLAAMQGTSFDDGITLILNFNMQSTDLILMENNQVQLVRKVGQGKQQLREILLRSLPSDSPLRRELMAIDFVLPTDHLALATDYVSSLLGEIRRSIEFYLTDIKRAEGNVSKVVLAGSGYWPANLPAILALQLHLPMHDLRFDRMPNVNCEQTFPSDFPACGIYAPVLGSVIRGVA
jgi:Tfp pilus assembly PilM family ATPase